MDEELNNQQEDEGEFFDLFDTIAAPFRGVEGAFQGVYNLADYILDDYLPDWDERFLGESQSTVGSLVESVSQFATGFGPIFGIAGKAGALAKAGKLGSLAKSGSLTQRALSNNLTRGTGAAIASDFSVFNGQEARLSNLIQQFPELQNPVTEFLAYEDGEGEIEGRLKNVLEGLGLEALTFGFIRGLKGMKTANDIRKKGGSPLEVYEGTVKEMGGDFVKLLPDFAEGKKFVREPLTEEDVLKNKSLFMWDGGYSLDEIARTLKIDKSRIQDYLLDIGEDSKDFLEGRKDTGFEVTRETQEAIGMNVALKMWDEGYSPDEISKTVNLEPKFIEQELISLGEDVRDIMVGRKDKGFDTGLDAFELSKRREDTALNAAIDMWQEGYSIREISKTVNFPEERLMDELVMMGESPKDFRGRRDRPFAEMPEFKERGELQQKLDDLGETIEDFDTAVERTPRPFKTYEEEAMMDIIPKGAGNLKSRLMKKFPIKGADPEDVADVEKFIDVMGQRLFGDVSLSVTNKIPSAGRYNFGNNLLQIRQATIDKGEIKRTMVHELWHSLSRYLPSTDVDSLTKQFQKERQNYLEDLSKRAKDKAKTPSERIALAKELNGFKKGEFTSDNYRYADVDEYFAEEMTDAFLKKLDEKDLAPQGTLKRIAQEVAILFKDMFASLKAKLGIDQRQKIFNDFLKQRNVKIQRQRPLEFGRTFADMPELDPTIKKAWQEAEVDIETPRGRLPNIGQLNSTDKFDQVRIAGRDWVKANLPDPGPKSYEEITEEAFADINNISPDLAKNFKATQIDTLEKAKALRDEVAVMKMFGKSLAKKVLDQAKEYRKTKGSDVALAKLKNTFQELIEFEAYYSAIGRETSLTLGIRRFTGEYKGRKVGVDEAEINTSEGIRNKYLNENGGLDPEQFIKLVDEATDDNDLDTTLTRMLKLAKKTQGNKLLNMTKEYWINAVLSGPRTHVVNMSGNFLTSFLSTLETAIGGALTGNMDVAKHAFGSWADWEMVKESWKFSKNAWKKGDNVLIPDSKAFDDGRVDAITPENMGLAEGDKLYKPMQGLGQFLRLPSRFLLTSDEWFKQMNYRRAARFKLAIEGLQGSAKIKDPYALAAYIEDGMQNVVTTGGRYYSKDAFVKQASAQADAKGLTGVKERSQYIQDYVRENFDENLSAIAEFAKDQTEYLTHTRELQKGTMGYAVQQFTKNWPVASFVLPFVRTPTNLLSFSFERFLPYQGIKGGRALLSKQYREEFLAEFKSPDPIVRSQAYGKLTTGTIMSGMLVDMMWNNREYITGGGPKDETQKKALEATGWQPYSFKVGDKYISYQRLDPIGTIIGVMADMVEVGVKHPKGFNQSPMEGVFAAIGITFSRNVTNKSYLSGVQMWTDALSEPERFVPRLLRNYTSSALPMSGFLGQSQYGAGEQEAREIRSIWEAMKNKTPGMRSSLDPKRNIMGESIMIENLPLIGALSPIATSSVKNDPVLTEMANLQHAFKNPPSTYNGVLDLLEFNNEKGQSAHDRRLEKLGTTRIGGRTMRQELERLINSKNYQRMSPISEPGLESPRVQMINKVLRKYRSQALEETMQEFPELSQYYDQITRARFELSMGADHSDVLSLLTAQ